MAGVDSQRSANRTKLANVEITCSSQPVDVINETDGWIDDDTEIPDCERRLDGTSFSMNMKANSVRMLVRVSFEIFTHYIT